MTRGGQTLAHSLATAIVAVGLIAAVSAAFAATIGASSAKPATPVGFAIPSDIPISLQIANSGPEDDRLLGGRSPLGDRVEVHHWVHVDGRRVMEPLPDGLVIPARSVVHLEGGIEHLMLFGVRADLVQGRSFPLTVHFERAGSVTVQVRVRRRVDAAGITPFPPVVAGDLRVSLAAAPPAPAEIRASPVAP